MLSPEKPDDEPEPALTPLLEPIAGGDLIVIGSMIGFVAVTLLFVAYCWWHARHGLA